MKKVFNTNELIHLFAQRTQNEGRTSTDSVFFKDNKIYSYGHHYLLGEFLDDETILINDEGYSKTTAKHISKLTGATRQYKQFFTKKCNIALVFSQFTEAKKKLVRANKPENYINEMIRLHDGLVEFLDYTKNKAVKKTKEFKEIASTVHALANFDKDFQQKLKDADKKRIEAIKRKNAKELKIALVKFNDYEIHNFRHGEEDFLRISQDGEKIETSQGVKVAVENAKMLYEMIKRGIDIKGKHIENYVVTSINGTLKIGCHNINIDSVHKVGRLL